MTTTTTDTTHKDFFQENPISFGLYNYHERSDYNILYINDNPDDLTFNLEIKNLSPETITLEKSTQSEPESPSLSNYHIELKFRPDQLSQRSREKIDLSEKTKEGWSMSRPYENRDRTVSLFLLKRQDDLVIEQGKAKVITLVGLGANSSEGTRVTQLEINYQDFYVAHKKSDTYGQRQIIVLTVLNYSGKRSADLTITFGYGRSILNNGSDHNKLVIQIVNTGQDAITLNENSKFEITIDAQAENRKEPWALAKKDEAKRVQISVESEQKINNEEAADSKKEINENPWTITLDEKGEEPSWTIQPDFEKYQRGTGQDGLEKFTLKRHQDLFITIDGIISTLPSGTGNLYVAYYNLPGYMDGKTTLNVTKTCITELKESGVGNGRIGINKYPDDETDLDVKGKIASDFLEVKEKVGAGSLEVNGEVVANSLMVNNTVSARKFEGEGAFVTGMIMMWSGAENALPYGWALCNGTKGTPDLRGKFILSAGDGYALNQSGGSKHHNYKVQVLDHQLTREEIPSHKHSYRIANRFDGRPDGGQDHRSGGYYWTDARWNGNDQEGYKTGWGDSKENNWHTSDVGGNCGHNHAATIQPEESIQMPPYYVLCFIMKIRMRDILATESEDLSLKKDDNKDIDWYTASGYKLAFQKNGNLVIYNLQTSSEKVVWATGTNGKAEKFTASKDGNFALIDSQNKPIWSTKTCGRNRLILEEDGNLVVYSKSSESNKKLFETGTQGGKESTTEAAKEWQNQL